MDDFDRQAMRALKQRQDLWLADTVYPGSRTLTKAGVRALDQIAQEFRKAAASVRSTRG